MDDVYSLMATDHCSADTRFGEGRRHQYESKQNNDPYSHINDQENSKCDLLPNDNLNLHSSPFILKLNRPVTN